MIKNHIDSTGSWITYGSGDCYGWYVGVAAGVLDHSGGVCSVNKKMIKDFCPNFKQPVLENLTE